MYCIKIRRSNGHDFGQDNRRNQPRYFVDRLKLGDLYYPLITGYNNHRASRLVVPLANKAVR
jgi:hypothetical protein